MDMKCLDIGSIVMMVVLYKQVYPTVSERHPCSSRPDGLCIRCDCVPDCFDLSDEKNCSEGLEAMKPHAPCPLWNYLNGKTDWLEDGVSHFPPPPPAPPFLVCDGSITTSSPRPTSVTSTVPVTSSTTRPTTEMSSPTTTPTTRPTTSFTTPTTNRSTKSSTKPSLSTSTTPSTIEPKTSSSTSTTHRSTFTAPSTSTTTTTASTTSVPTTDHPDVTTTHACETSSSSLSTSTTVISTEQSTLPTRGTTTDHRTERFQSIWAFCRMKFESVKNQVYCFFILLALQTQTGGRQSYIPDYGVRPMPRPLPYTRSPTTTTTVPTTTSAILTPPPIPGIITRVPTRPIHRPDVPADYYYDDYYQYGSQTPSVYDQPFWFMNMFGAKK